MSPEISTAKTTRAHAQVETLTTLSALVALRSDWAALWSECSFATPFQSPEWLIPWARRWAAESLHVIVVRRAGELIGLASFFIYTSPESGERSMVLLGNGISDTLDLLAVPGCTAVVGEAVMATLEEQAGRRDLCDWQQLRAGSPLLTSPAPFSWGEHIEPHDAWPTVTLPVDELISAHFAARLASDRHRLERLGPVHFERATAETMDSYFDSLRELHAARWSSCNQTGVLADPDVEAFHREAAAGLMARGVLRLYRLVVGERVAAAYYGFQHRDRASYYLGGFDPALGAFGLGNQIVWHALRCAHEEGARVFDFLRGREIYKYRWGAVDVPAFRRRLTPRSGPFPSLS